MTSVDPSSRAGTLGDDNVDGDGFLVFSSFFVGVDAEEAAAAIDKITMWNQVLIQNKVKKMTKNTLLLCPFFDTFGLLSIPLSLLLQNDELIRCNILVYEHCVKSYQLVHQTHQRQLTSFRDDENREGEVGQEAGQI